MKMYWLKKQQLKIITQQIKDLKALKKADLYFDITRHGLMLDYLNGYTTKAEIRALGNSNFKSVNNEIEYINTILEKNKKAGK